MLRRARLPRLSVFLVWLALWCATLSSATSTLRGGLVTSQDEAPPASTSAAPTPLAPVRVMPQSQCAACRDWSTCDLAYRGRPGKFCADLWWTGRPCCCPLGSQCVWDVSRCLCREMLFGESTPMISLCFVGAFVFVGLLLCIDECINPSPPRTGGGGGGASVSEQSHVFTHDTNYGSTFSGDTGDSGGTFAGDSGGDGGSFAGDS